jgi:hypothetical protein
MKKIIILSGVTALCILAATSVSVGTDPPKAAAGSENWVGWQEGQTKAHWVGWQEGLTRPGIIDYRNQAI